MIELNKGQVAVVDEIVDFYYTESEYFYLLDSPAGTGKTTCIQRAVKTIQEGSPRELQICLTAPTNKATKVLRNMSADFGIKVDCKTIYSLLGLVLNSNNEVRHAAKMANGAFSDYDLVVVDEASMIGGYLWEVLEKEALEYCVKVVMMSDKAQLKPVKEKISKVFSKDLRKGQLTKVERQAADNPVLTLATAIREAQSDPRVKIEYLTEVNPVTEHGVYLLSAPEWINWILENFTSPEYAADPDSFRCLAYTNARVNTLNKMIRDRLVGKTLSPFIAGERVLVKHPISSEDGEEKIHTDEECTVMDVVETTHPLYRNTSTQFKVWEIELKSDSHTFVTAYLLHKDSSRAYDKMLDSLGKAAQEDGRRWKSFWGFKDSFASLQSPHAMTVHRSQGSTYKNVFVDMRDIYRNRDPQERMQLEYVAVSRASETLIILR